MKRIVAVLAFLLWASPAWAVLTCPANVTAIGPSATSCWPLQETTGTAITDTIDSNSGTISGSFTLNQNGGILCDGDDLGCNITTPTNLTNPQPMTFYFDFAGTFGGIAQLGTPSGITGAPYYVIFLDNHGKLTFGVSNFGVQQIIQSPLPYADGNRHKGAISVGPLGEKLYVDGTLVASRNVTLANFVQGFWFFGGINTTGWQLSPSNQNFEGSLYTFAWWNGTQLTDQQADTLTGGNPTPITNSYCSFSNQIASLNPATAQAYANQRLTFTTPALQTPGMCSSLPIAPSTLVCLTDSTGTILPGCQIQQGAHVNLSVGSGPQIPLVIPCSTTCDLTAITLSQTDPPEVVSAVAVAGPGFAGYTVTNPPPGTIGTATITAPAAFSQTQSSTATVNIQTNGNVQQVIMTGNSVTINLTNFTSGADFKIDTTQDNTGGRAPVFTAPPAFTPIQWVGGGSQPTLPSTAPNSHTIWEFIAVSNTVLAGSITSFSTSAGVFPLSATANFNNYSGTNINILNLVQLTAPAGLNVTPTCSGTCATTYTYEVSCRGDASSETTASSAVTTTNAATLDGTHFNVLNWTNETACHVGYNIYGRIGGSLGVIGTVGAGVTTFTDNSLSAPGASPPTTNTTGQLNVGGNSVLMGTTTALSPVTLGSAGGTSGKLIFSGSTSGSAAIKVAAVAGTPADLVLPTSSGGAGSVLKNDGSGNLSWGSVSTRSNLQTGNPLATVSNSTTETTLFTYSLAGNTLTANGTLKCHAEGNYLNNSGMSATGTLSFYYGASALTATPATVSAPGAVPGSWILDTTLSTTGATNTEWVSSTGITGNGIAEGGNVTGSSVISRTTLAAVDSTSAQTVKLTVTMGTNTATQTFSIYTSYCELK